MTPKKNVATILFVIILISTSLYYLVLKKTALGNSGFYTNGINQYFIDDTKGCLDICLVRSYKKLPVDPNTFKILSSPRCTKGCGYGKDNSSVYYYGTEVSADPATFKAIDYHLGQDKNGYILSSTRLEDYFKNTLSSDLIINPSSVNVLSYFRMNYLVFEYEGRFYRALTGSSPSLTEIQASEVGKVINFE